VVAAVFWFYWFWVERRVETSFVRLGFMVDICNNDCISLLHVFIVDLYTYQLYHFSTLVVLLRQKISFTQNEV
jgi:hypothetical protein